MLKLYSQKSTQHCFQPWRRVLPTFSPLNRKNFCIKPPTTNAPRPEPLRNDLPKIIDDKASSLPVPPTDLEAKERDPESDSSSPLEEESDYDDPEIHDSPSAWVLNRTADTLHVASSIAAGTLKIGSYIAKTGIESASEAATSVLPKGNIPLPDIVKETADTVSSAATYGIGTILGGFKGAGNFAGQVVGSTVGQFLTGQEKGSEYATLKAASRLARVSVKSYSTVAGAIADTTQEIHSSAKKEAISVVSHVAGEDVGRVIEAGSKVSEQALNLGVSFKTLGQGALKDVASEARKKMAKHVVKATQSSSLNEIQKAKQSKNQNTGQLKE